MEKEAKGEKTLGYSHPWRAVGVCHSMDQPGVQVMSKSVNPWAASMSPKSENLETLLLTYDEAARLLRVCKRTVERLVARGELPVVRVGRMPRISRAALMQWLERGSGFVAAAPVEDEHGQRGF
ncbi:MAG: helix-turn-helix domain-containing protein [Tepidisphaeraceae bacterium]